MSCAQAPAPAKGHDGLWGREWVNTGNEFNMADIEDEVEVLFSLLIFPAHF